MKMVSKILLVLIICSSFESEAAFPKGVVMNIAIANNHTITNNHPIGNNNANNGNPPQASNRDYHRGKVLGLVGASGTAAGMVAFLLYGYKTGTLKDNFQFLGTLGIGFGLIFAGTLMAATSKVKRNTHS